MGADFRLSAIESQIADIEGFVEKLKLNRPLLVGHSMGGFAAIGYAMGNSQSMAGLVLVDIGPEINMEGGKRIRDFITQDRELDSVDAFVQRAMDFNPRRNPELLRRSLIHNLRRIPNGKWTWKHDPKRMPTEFRERTGRPRQADHGQRAQDLLPDADLSRRSERRILRPECREFRLSLCPTDVGCASRTRAIRSRAIIPLDYSTCCSRL